MKAVVSATSSTHARVGPPSSLPAPAPLPQPPRRQTHWPRHFLFWVLSERAYTAKSILAWAPYCFHWLARPCPLFLVTWIFNECLDSRWPGSPPHRDWLALPLRGVGKAGFVVPRAARGPSGVVGGRLSKRVTRADGLVVSPASRGAG